MLPEKITAGICCDYICSKGRDWNYVNRCPDQTKYQADTI